MSRETLLIIVTAMIAGAIGFGIAVYAAPLEEIVQFRALIDAGLGAITTTNHPDNDDTIAKQSTSAPSKISPELDSLARDRSDTRLICDPRCLDGSPTKATTPNEVLGRDQATQNRQHESGGALQAPAPTNEPARVPCLSPNSGNEKARVVPGAHLRPKAKKFRVKNSPRSANEN